MGVPVRSRQGLGSGSALDLGQVHGQVVGEPAVAGPEGLALGGLGVRLDPGPVFVGVEGDYPIIADPEPFAAPGEVDMLGGEAKRPGAGVDSLLPLYGPAPEGAGPVVETPGYSDADAVGGARRSRRTTVSR